LWSDAILWSDSTDASASTPDPDAILWSDLVPEGD
jgi:hypothetical protein